jgi:YfiH family protein
MAFDDLYFTVPGFVPDDVPVFHGFFGRQGGVSTGIYSALNCGPGSDDNPADVKENRRRVAEAAGCTPHNLLSLYQVHGDECVTVDKPYDPQARPEADAYVTDQAGIALGILTADCTPILFYGLKGSGEPVIGAAHAGWGGALKGISQSTVEAMEKLGAVRETIVACIGPCISQESYEVSQGFEVPFLAEDPANEKFFDEAKREGHLMFDLAGYNAFKLYKLGLRKVLIKGLDTFFNEEDFFSYRRTTHRKERDYGRQISVIKIN